MCGISTCSAKPATAKPTRPSSSASTGSLPRVHLDTPPVARNRPVAIRPLTSLPNQLSRPPTAPGDETVLVAMDVEWTKNHRVRSGNIPFCYSLGTITIPPHPAGQPVPIAQLTLGFTSAYVEDADETQFLICCADAALNRALGLARYLVSRQLSSDLAILSNAATSPCPRSPARTAWMGRRQPSKNSLRILDARYDADAVLGCTGRRLVDVCTDLGLDATLPGEMTPAASRVDALSSFPDPECHTLGGE